MRSQNLCAAILGLGVIAAQPAVAGSGDNWMRDHVRAREHAMLERVLGREAAAHEAVQPQIVGGNVARAGRWPFQAALVAASIPDNSLAQYCGASVIDARFVLTAAHCVDFVTAADIRVLTNTQSLVADGAGGGIRHAVKRIRIHPRWNPRAFDFDVAVLMLKDSAVGIPPGRRAQIIAPDEEPVLAPPRTRAFVTGWGSMQPGFPNQLREAKVPLVERRRCNRPESYDGLVTRRMLCAGFARGGRDACQGDSGGPLVVRNADGKYRTQVGIVSWGIGCALPNFYGVYSRLAVLGPWVERVVSALSPSGVANGLATACGQSQNPSSAACVRLATIEAKREMQSYLDMIRRKGSSAQIHAAKTAQAAWLRLLPRLCAFDAASGGPGARNACIARETRARADTLAGQIAELGRD